MSSHLERSVERLVETQSGLLLAIDQLVENQTRLFSAIEHLARAIQFPATQTGAQTPWTPNAKTAHGSRRSRRRLGNPEPPGPRSASGSSGLSLATYELYKQAMRRFEDDPALGAAPISNTAVCVLAVGDLLDELAQGDVPIATLRRLRYRRPRGEPCRRVGFIMEPSMAIRIADTLFALNRGRGTASKVTLSRFVEVALEGRSFTRGLVNLRTRLRRMAGLLE